MVLGSDGGDSGTYNLNGGLLVLSGSGLTQGSGSAAFNFGGGTLGASAPWSSPLNMTLTGSGGKSTVDTTGGNISLSGNLSGNGGLDKIGSGTLILSGSDDYAGGTYVDAGMLEVTDYDALPEGGSLTVGSGGKFAFDGLASGSSAASPAGGVAAVPEPGTLALSSVAGIVVALLANSRLRRRPVGCSSTSVA